MLFKVFYLLNGLVYFLSAARFTLQKKTEKNIMTDHEKPTFGMMWS